MKAFLRWTCKTFRKWEAIQETNKYPHAGRTLKQKPAAPAPEDKKKKAEEEKAKEEAALEGLDALFG
jgi:ribosomal protein L12E/L44/L45/RPP1/RPP2